MSQDGDNVDNSDTDELETSDDDDGPPLERVEATLQSLDALSTQTETLRQKLEETHPDRSSLREVVASLRAENSDLRQSLERLDARTGLLDLVETAGSMDGEQRSVTLVQHLERAAERQRDRSQSARASVNRHEAEAALHHPDVDRTTIYDDIRRAARLVGREGCRDGRGDRP